LTGVWAGHENVRYFYALPLALTYAWIGWLYARKRPKVRSAASIALILMMGFQIKTNATRMVQSPLSQPYLESNQCLDDYIKESGNHEGIASYWGAKWSSFLSREGARVLQVNESLAPYYWINNHDWYRDFHPRFALVGYFSDGELSPARLAALGEPERKVDCKRFQIWQFPASVTLLKESKVEVKYKNFQEFR
jgi:hypothetical protein